MRLSFASVKEVTQGYMRRQFASQILSTLWSPCSALRSCGHHPALKIFDEGPLDGVLRDWVPKPNTFDLFFPLQPNQTRCVHPKTCPGSEGTVQILGSEAGRPPELVVGPGLRGVARASDQWCWDLQEHRCQFGFGFCL